MRSSWLRAFPRPVPPRLDPAILPRMATLEPYIREKLTFVLKDVKGGRDELFGVLSAAVDDLIPELDRKSLVERLIEREKQHSTATPEGVAFPHALSPEIDTTLVLPVKVTPGIDFGGAPTNPPSDLIFCMFGPTSDPWQHVRLLARLARIVRSEDSRARLRAATDASDLFQRLLTEDRSYG